MNTLPLNRPRLATEVFLTLGFAAAGLNFSNAVMANAEQIDTQQQDVLVPYEQALHPERTVSVVAVDSNPADDPGFFQLPPAVQEAEKQVAGLESDLTDNTIWTFSLLGGSLAVCASLGLHVRSKKFPPPKKSKAV